MEWLEIRGGKPLQGSLTVQGSKNAALPMMAAALMAEGSTTLENVPDLQDVRAMNLLIGQLGGKVVHGSGNGIVSVDATALNCTSIDEVFMRTMRSSLFLLGPLLSRFGRAEVALPGGCAIGERKIDLHLHGFQRMGAMVSEKGRSIRVTVPGGRLNGAVIPLSFPSVGATENLMMAACCAKGDTEIRNAAREPEIVNLQQLLNQMGADVQGAGTGTVRIRGKKSLHPPETAVRVIPDRIAAGTWMIAAAVTGGTLQIHDVEPFHLEALIHIMRTCGVEIRTGADRNIWIHSGRKHVSKERIVTAPFPLFPTDLQAQMMVFLALAEGRSVIRETIFEKRFQHVPALQKMGAEIRITGNDAIITGVSRLRPETVEATDLRAGAALVLAALAAGGTSLVGKLGHIDRGYEQIEMTLGRVGADCRRTGGEIHSEIASVS